MTITDRNEAQTASAKKELSPQVRTAIAVAALLACLLIGAGIIYWLLFASSPKRRVVQVDPKEQQAAMPTPAYRAPQRRDVPGVTKSGDEWIVRSTTGEMRLRDKASSAADPIYRFPNALKLPPEQVSLLAGRFRILHDEAMAQEWKVTPQQVERLRNLQVGGSEMNPSPQQRSELWKLWTQFNNAPNGQAKIEAQKKLIDQLETTAKSLVEPVRQQYASKLEEVKNILTPQQVEIITRR